MTHPNPNPHPNFIPPHGNHKKLLSYQKAEIIYDITFRFCHQHLGKGDRTVDQMIQAARSGKQNIVEGVQNSGTSKQTEIKLLSVARGSLAELLTDYQDYLRVRDHPTWAKDSKEALYIRNIDQRLNAPATYETFRPFIETRPPGTIANIAICLIHQANYLLDRQIRQAESDFIKNGGIREQMTRARIDYRNKNK